MNRTTHLLGGILAISAGLGGWLTGSGFLYILSGMAMGCVATSIYERTKQNDAWRASRFDSTNYSGYH